MINLYFADMQGAWWAVNFHVHLSHLMIALCQQMTILMNSRVVLRSATFTRCQSNTV